MIPGGAALPWSGAVRSLSLIHFDEAHGSTSATDVYPANTVALYGGATITTATSRFGSASLVATSTDVDSGFRVTPFTALAAAFTLEAWVSFPSTATTQARYVLCAFNTASYGVILEKDYSAPNHRLTLYISTASNQYNVSTASNIAAPSADTWHHVAVVRDPNAGNYYSYWNGTAVHTVSTTNTAIGIASLAVGGQNRKLMGYLDEFRYSPVCRYPGGNTFTPSTSAFTE